jgi:hypothetical protein
MKKTSVLVAVIVACGVTLLWAALAGESENVGCNTDKPFLLVSRCKGTRTAVPSLYCAEWECLRGYECQVRPLGAGVEIVPGMCPEDMPNAHQQQAK